MTIFDTVGFGALNVDKLFKVNKIAVAEEESFISDFDESCGGSAANTIVGLARLGRSVGFIGKVAEDKEGRLLLEDLRRESVNTDGVRTAKRGRSGTVLGFVDTKGARALYVDAGVNNEIAFEEVDRNCAFQTKFLHLTSFVGELSFQSQRRLVEDLPTSVRISFDPGALYAERGLMAMAPIIERTFVLMPNAGELELLTGLSNYKEGAEAMLARGVKILAVKLGNKGCYVTNGKENYSIKASKVRVIDTTGAGDAFNAGFLYGLLSAKSLRECGELGNFVASRCVMKVGARSGLPRLRDLKLLDQILN